MRRFMSVMVMVSLLLFGFGGIPVSAAVDSPQVFSPPGRGAAAAFVPNQIIVKFKDDSKPFRVIRVPAGAVTEKVAEYSRRADVVYAEPNYYAQAFSVPNDPFYKDYPYQWNFKGSDQGGIGMESAWDLSTGAGVTVAVIDTGIAYETYDTYTQAPDLAGTSFAAGYDYVNNDPHANDDNSHGTHVAGTIAQSTNNGIGTAGIAYNATLMPIKVLDKSGSGTYDAIADGIYFAANHGARVINMSLGGSSPSPTLENALKYAHEREVTIVAAAGNDGSSTISYPAAYDDYVIAVGATRYDKKKAGYSNYGAGLDLMAPGGDLKIDQNHDGYKDGILQNTFNPTSKVPSDFGYWFFQGTSMASPHVAGAAALLIAYGNAVSPDQVRQALQETALDLGDPGRDDTYGYGLLNAYAALNWGTVSNQAPEAMDQSVTTQINTPLDITLQATDADGDPLTYSITSGPLSGTLSPAETETVYTYLPTSGYIGADSFEFTVSDGKLESTGTVTITVTDRAAAPTVTVVEMEAVSKKAGKKYLVSAKATVQVDVDGTAVSGATVSGHWSGATSDTDTGLTGADGRVTVQSNQVSYTSTSLLFTFVMDSVTVGGTNYASAASGSITYPPPKP